MIGKINEICRYLALRDLPSLTPDVTERAVEGSRVELLVLLGSGILYVAEEAFRAFRSGAAEKLMIVGGVGHSTDHLVEAIRANPKYRSIGTAGKSEAEMLREVAVLCGISHPERILLETESTNCGNNATYALEVLSSRGRLPSSMILMQDPTMQRRTDASFRKAWTDAGAEARFYNYAAFTPQVIGSSKAFKLDTRDGELGQLWEPERFIALIMGEIRRLCDDENGYGPNGKGFIMHVDVPERVLAAYSELLGMLDGGSEWLKSR